MCQVRYLKYQLIIINLRTIAATKANENSFLQLLGVSTATAKHQKDVFVKNIINNNNEVAGDSNYVGVQSR